MQKKKYDVVMTLICNKLIYYEDEQTKYYYARGYLDALLQVGYLNIQEHNILVNTFKLQGENK